MDTEDKHLDALIVGALRGEEPRFESCGKCGSDMMWVECYQCCGEGVDGHECGEDCCCCADPEDNMTCAICNGDGGWWTCLGCSAKVDNVSR